MAARDSARVDESARPCSADCLGDGQLPRYITRGLGLEAVLPEVGVLLGFAALFLPIGVWRFRYE